MCLSWRPLETLYCRYEGIPVTSCGFDIKCQLRWSGSPRKTYHTNTWSSHYGKAMLPLLGLAAHLFLGNSPLSVQSFFYCGRAHESWWPCGSVCPGYPQLLPWGADPVPWQGGLVIASRVVASSLGTAMMGEWGGGVVLRGHWYLVLTGSVSGEKLNRRRHGGICCDPRRW